MPRGAAKKKKEKEKVSEHCQITEKDILRTDGHHVGKEKYD